MELRERFSLAPSIDCDIDVGGEGDVALVHGDRWLKEAVYSAVIARRLGNSSIDYTRKKYASHIPDTSDNDEPVKTLCRLHLAAYDQFYRTIPERTDAPIGVFAFDLTMIRARTGFELLLYAARRGYLVECCLIARGLVEQFAYAHFVWDKTDDSAIFENMPQRLLAGLKSVYPSAGRIYGDLSKLAHFDPRMHYEFIGVEGASAIIQRSWRFKIVSLTWIYVLLDMKLRLMQRAYGDDESFRRATDPIAAAPILTAFDNFFENVETPAVGIVRRFLERA